MKFHILISTPFGVSYMRCSSNGREMDSSKSPLLETQERKWAFMKVKIKFSILSQLKKTVGCWRPSIVVAKIAAMAV